MGKKTDATWISLDSLDGKNPSASEQSDDFQGNQPGLREAMKKHSDRSGMTPDQVCKRRT